MIYFNNRNGSSGLTCSLIPRLIFATADGTAHYAEKVGDTQQIAQLGFDLAHNDVRVHSVSHYLTPTDVPPTSYRI